MKRICKVFIPQNSRFPRRGHGGGGARSESLPPEWPDKNMEGVKGGSWLCWDVKPGPCLPQRRPHLGSVTTTRPDHINFFSPFPSPECCDTTSRGREAQLPCLLDA